MVYILSNKKYTKICLWRNSHLNFLSKSMLSKGKNVIFWIKTFCRSSYTSIFMIFFQNLFESNQFNSKTFINYFWVNFCYSEEKFFFKYFLLITLSNQFQSLNKNRRIHNLVTAIVLNFTTILSIYQLRLSAELGNPAPQARLFFLV